MLIFFHRSMDIEVNLITGRTISQGVAIETGKDNEGYKEATGICEFCSDDLKKLGAQEGDTVRISTQDGEVFVKAKGTRETLKEGLIFIPLGPWANVITGFDTSSTGMPTLKGVKASVSLAKDEKVLGVKELLNKMYGKIK
jgi:formylmethanofuran dehydrogenase subunit D|tara:strand:- start:3850 stop:4272 length:423 start_codon:yes stop_codon:yes gene_type:complete